MKKRRCSEDRELKEVRSKLDPVDLPVRSARTIVHHYKGTQYCGTETVLLIGPFIQTMCCHMEVRVAVSGPELLLFSN